MNLLEKMAAMVANPDSMAKEAHRIAQELPKARETIRHHGNHCADVVEAPMDDAEDELSQDLADYQQRQRLGLD